MLYSAAVEPLIISIFVICFVVGLIVVIMNVARRAKRSPTLSMPSRDRPRSKLVAADMNGQKCPLCHTRIDFIVGHPTVVTDVRGKGWAHTGCAQVRLIERGDVDLANEVTHDAEQLAMEHSFQRGARGHGGHSADDTGLPRTIVSTHYSTCPVCRNDIYNNNLITKLPANFYPKAEEYPGQHRRWAHAGCAQQYFRDKGQPELADAIAADSAKVRQANDERNRAKGRMGRTNNPRLHDPASQIIVIPDEVPESVGTCGLCGIVYRGGDVITQAISKSWAHAQCAAKEYEQHGQPKVAEMVRADERAINHPPTIMATHGGRCRLCGADTAGDPITFYLYAQQWVHSECLWRKYEEWGKPEIADLILADAERLD